MKYFQEQKITDSWTQKILIVNISKRTHYKILILIVVTKGMYNYTLKVTRNLGHFLSYYRFKNIVEILDKVEGYGYHNLFSIYIDYIE